MESRFVGQSVVDLQETMGNGRLALKRQNFGSRDIIRVNSKLVAGCTSENWSFQETASQRPNRRMKLPNLEFQDYLTFIII